MRLNGWLVVALIAVILAGCGRRSETKKERPTTPIAPTKVGVQNLLEQVSGEKPRPYMTYDFGRGQDPRAVSVVVPESEALNLVAELHPYVPAGWLAFAGTYSWAGTEQHDNATEVVIGPGSNQFDIVRLARTDGVNYDLSTADVIRKLKSYDTQVGIQILQANTDTVVVRIKRLPRDVPAFSRDVYRFCPDIVDQGAGSVAALETDLTKNRMLYFWWD
jgi:hypothetical protein